MRVLYFGSYERRYPRNAQVISCLRSCGVEVDERHEPVWEGGRQWDAGAATGARLAAALLRLRRRVTTQYDAVIVGYPGHLDIGAARRAVPGTPVVFNPLVSLSDTLVADRGRFRDGSVPARLLEAVDRRALRAADLVVADTAAHAAFLAALGRIPGERVRVCLVGAEDRVFRPGWDGGSGPFTALFVGKLIPLHGLETILEAARRAPGIPFRIVGSGQLGRLLADAPPNVDTVPWVGYELLPAELYAAGCALGVFGTSPKAARVIPNKAFQALACGTPLVTADTPAARELLTDGDDALLVPAGDPGALAAAVERLAGDPALAARLGAAGRARYAACASEAVLGPRWRDLLASVA